MNTNQTTEGGAKPPARIPAIYRGYGMPLYWRDEVTGELGAAVAKYFDHFAHHKPAPTDGELALLWEYVGHHINAPCWTRTCAGHFDDELAALRARAAERGGLQALRDYVNAAMDIALDPF